MALADVLALYRTALAAGAFAGSAELGSDLRDDLDSIPAGGLRYQLRVSYVGVHVQSTTTRHRWQVEVTIARKLGVGEAERAYTEGASTGMVAQQQELGGLGFWRVAGVYDVAPDEKPELEPAERVGKVVRWTMRAVIILSA